MKGSTDIPPEELEGHPATTAEYQKYLDLLNTRGWWNNYTLNNFTFLDYLQLLLSMEFSGSSMSSISSTLMQQVVIRNFYYVCGKTCNPGNPYDVFRYIALKQFTTFGKRSVAPEALAGYTGSLNKTNFIASIRKDADAYDSAWESGCGDGNQPCDWGNYSMKDCTPETCEWLFKDHPDLNTNKMKARFERAYSKSSWAPDGLPSTDVNSFYLMAGRGDSALIMTSRQVHCSYYGEGEGCIP